MRTVMFLAALAVLPPCAVASCPAEISSLYPSTIAPTAVREITCATVPVGGRTFIAAIFSNGADCRLRIAEATSAGIQLVSESPEPLAGHAQAITPIDLNHDGRQELMIATWSQHNDDAAWFFALGDDGTTRLLSLGTDDDGGPITDPVLFDLDGDGTTDVVDVKVGRENDSDGADIAIPHYTAYTFRDGAFGKDTRMIYGVARVTRHQGKPTQASYPFTVPAPGAYLITLVNGTSNADRCTAGIVRNNEVVVFPEADFKQHDARVQKTVTLNENEGTLDIELRSGPECNIIVWIGEEHP